MYAPRGKSEKYAFITLYFSLKIDTRDSACEGLWLLLDVVTELNLKGPDVTLTAPVCRRAVGLRVRRVGRPVNTQVPTRPRRRRVTRRRGRASHADLRIIMWHGAGAHPKKLEKACSAPEDQFRAIPIRRSGPATTSQLSSLRIRGRGESA